MGQKDVSCHKKGARKKGAVIVFVDEASFRQDPTLFRTWARCGHQPRVLTYGRRNTQHALGAVSLTDASFTYRFATPLNGETYLTFLVQIVRVFGPEPVVLIADNARYHTHPDVVQWTDDHRDQITLRFLPPYSPEFNPMERVWGHVRRCATHNRFFETVPELLGCLRCAFRQIQRCPASIEGYLAPHQ